MTLNLTATSSTTTIDYIEQHAAELVELAVEDEQLGRLHDRTAEILRESGIIRMLQPPEHGGQAAHPARFAEAVMAVARCNGAAGWVAGVVGVHPWEVAVFDPRVGEEIWADDQDTWIASPFAPTGLLTPTDGGYRLTGRWQFSSGTDHCQWAFLGGMLSDGSGKPALPPRMFHVILPRADYQIVEDSWDVIGLSGTGSKDVVVEDAFIPFHRTREYDDVASGTAAEMVGRTETAYKLPFYVAFPAGITAAIIGMAEGGIAAHAALQRDRIGVLGAKIRDDPYAAYFTAQAASDVHASRLQLLDGLSWSYERLDAGHLVTFEDRARLRRNQVRAAWRAVAALDEILPRSGGNVIRRDNPIQRFWRDAHVGLQHMIHGPGTVYHASALTMMGLEVPLPLQVAI